MKAVFTSILFLLSFAAFSLTCSKYVITNHSHDDRYLYRLSYSDIPADSPIIRLGAQEEGALPARTENENLILKMKRGDDEIVRCYYPIENKNGPMQGQTAFSTRGFSCPILNFDRCNIDIPA